MSNPMDIIEVARDLIRKDEAQHLFDLLLAEDVRVNREYGLNLPDETVGYLDGLKFAMDELDARIGFLRDRWTDSGILVMDGRAR